MRIFVPVVVRGEEAEGVKLWQFGKELYMDFLNLADNEDVGDLISFNIGVSSSLISARTSSLINFLRTSSLLIYNK